ncbi:MAG: hypothetical protein CML06_18700 [Pseudomonadales bacterium]|nr:hypothetical protein [Pseudomonadales bacterium]
MSYQVLARKWRPKTFREMVGQEHVLKALVNALDHGRLHHAYLFTGTRGVGKTTIARILAKSLNCETGISSEPCGQCSACVEINEGRFVDLIEVDAASRTKVEDTRELLENVQYAPTRGRYKVYLIDEVHMLSGHSFNALLKTLEEPPEHVKFLLATTDPQKLPVTVLSRCLQFSLKAMTPERIVGHLQQVLEAELVTFEEPALWLLARAAEGSMRDAMSLTDQAIAFGNGKVTVAEARAMLGSIDREYVFGILEALAREEAGAVLCQVAEMAEQSPDYSGVLADLISALHRLAVAQLAPDAVDDSDGDRQRTLELAGRFAAEQLQLFYQTALLGRRDLALAPDARSGFEMILLRMLLFRPQTAAAPTAGGSPPGKSPSPAAAGPASEPVSRPAAEVHGGSEHLSRVKAALAAGDQSSARPKQPESPVATAPRPVAPANPAPPGGNQQPAVRAPPPPDSATAGQPTQTPSAKPPPKTTPGGDKTVPKVVHLNDEWADLVSALELPAPVRNFARNCALEAREGEHWTLALSPRFEALYRESHLDDLARAIGERLGGRVQLKLKQHEPATPTPDQLLAAHQQQRKAQAVARMQEDQLVRDLQQLFNATLDIDSVTPVDDQ